METATWSSGCRAASRSTSSRTRSIRPGRSTATSTGRRPTRPSQRAVLRARRRAPSTRTPRCMSRTAGTCAPTSRSTPGCAGTASRSSTPRGPSRSISTSRLRAAARRRLGPERGRTSKVFASFGRYYERSRWTSSSAPTRSSASRASSISTREHRARSGGRSGARDGSAIFGGFTTPSDPDLEGQYIREFIVGDEREVLPHVRSA